MQVKSGTLDKHGRKIEGVTPATWEKSYVDYSVTGEEVRGELVGVSPPSFILFAWRAQEGSVLTTPPYPISPHQTQPPAPAAAPVVEMEVDAAPAPVAAAAVEVPATEETKEEKKEKKRKRKSEAAAAGEVEEVEGVVAEDGEKKVRLVSGSHPSAYITVH